MTALTDALDSIRAKLSGHVVDDDEFIVLRDAVSGKLLPLWFVIMMKTYPLAGTNFLLSDERDESELGVDMLWLDPSQMADECSNAFPGIAAAKLGYLPIGVCLEGSGDPYFALITASDDPPMVRVPHEAVHPDGELDVERAEVVSQTLSNFFKHAEIEKVRPKLY
jgi:hypothetical protein